MEIGQGVGGREAALLVPAVTINIVMYQMKEEGTLKAEGISAAQGRRRRKINLCF